LSTPVAVAVDDALVVPLLLAPPLLLLPAGSRELGRPQRACAVLLSVPGAARTRPPLLPQPTRPSDARPPPTAPLPYASASAGRAGRERSRRSYTLRAPLVAPSRAILEAATDVGGAAAAARRGTPPLGTPAARESASRAAGRRSRERHDSRMSDSGGSHESMEDIERDGCGSGRPTSNGQT